MLIRRTRQIAAAAIGALVLVVVLLLYVPMMIARPDVDSLNYVTDTLVFAGTFLVASSAVALREQRLFTERRLAPASHSL